jgi:hypothetical protein
MSESPVDGPGGPEAPQRGPNGLLAGRFSGRVEFQELVREALAAAAREGWHELVLSDATFEDWPLGERAVEESLNAWARAGRRCILLAKHYDELGRRHARFVSWRKTWAHVVEAHAWRSADAQDFPSAIWSPSWAMHRLDPERSSGIATFDAQRRLQLRESLDECVRRSSPAFPASTLGL